MKFRFKLLCVTLCLALSAAAFTGCSGLSLIHISMPWKFNGQLLTYRSDLIDTPPSTWEEYLAMAEEYTSGDMVGVSLALSLNSIMDIYLCLLYTSRCV